MRLALAALLFLGPCDKGEQTAPADPPVPITSATTPPVWTPPDTTPPTSVAASSSAAPVSSDYPKAKAAADAKDWKKVRTILEKKVRNGKGTPEEVALMLDCCAAMKDKPCTDAVHAKYP